MSFCAGIVGLLLVSRLLPLTSTTSQTGDTPVVAVQNGVQIITIAAKGGFSPEHIQAQGGLPTELHVVTNGTYDCSSTLVIPSLAYEQTLKPTGTEIIPIPAKQATGTLDGTCGMGMYSFEVVFI